MPKTKSQQDNITWRIYIFSKPSFCQKEKKKLYRNWVIMHENKSIWQQVITVIAKYFDSKDKTNLCFLLFWKWLVVN